MLDSNIINKITGLATREGERFTSIGNLSSGESSEILSWIIDSKYLNELETNSNIKGVITDETLSKNIVRKDLVIYISDDPMSDAIRLLNYVTLSNKKDWPSTIGEGTSISPLAYIQNSNVSIGKNCIIEPFASIHRDVVIGDNVIIRSGARIGGDNFDRHFQKNGTPLRLESLNRVVINDNCEIGYNTVVDKGDSGRDTIIGKNTLIHDGVQVCHGVHLGINNLIWGGVFFCGHSTIGDYVRIQPRSIIGNIIKIGNNAYIGINSVVTTDVGEGESFLGKRSLTSKSTIDDLRAKLNREKK
jgi:UDP-3-O-[3-hydroxymyristoyl] glucosamine N-acyltransferase LpxD